MQQTAPHPIIPGYLTKDIISFSNNWLRIIVCMQLQTRMNKNMKEMEALRDHLAKHQLKLTRQRELILSAFLKQEHVTAETMYHQLAKKDPHLGLATIYRTLNLFCEAGLAQARHFGTQTQYDNVSHKGHHDHLICTGCGALIEFYNEQIEQLQDEIVRRYRFKPLHHSHRIFGICLDCQKAQKAAAAKARASVK